MLRVYMLKRIQSSKVYAPGFCEPCKTAKYHDAEDAGSAAEQPVGDAFGRRLRKQPLACSPSVRGRISNAAGSGSAGAKQLQSRLRGSGGRVSSGSYDVCDPRRRASFLLLEALAADEACAGYSEG